MWLYCSRWREAPLLEKIIPHFDSYPLSNLKQKDFVNFKESMNLIKLNKHLTAGAEGAAV